METPIVEQNLSVLAEKMKRMGLPKSLLSRVARQIEINPYGLFYLSCETEVDYKKVWVSLSFFRPAGADKYDLTSMTVKLKPRRSNILDKNCFDLMEGPEVSLREAVNLMQGRSVHRLLVEEPPISRWLYLNPTCIYRGVAKLDFHLSYLDVEKALKELPFGKRLKKKERTDLIESLQAGDMGSWAGRVRGQYITVYLRVNAEGACIDMLDGNREPLGRRVIEDLHSMEED